MLSRLTSTKETFVKVVKNEYFRATGTLGSGSNFLLAVVNFGGPEEKGDNWTLKTLNIDYGIFDDPLDENLTFAFYWAVPTSSSPDIRNNAGLIWVANQNYRVVTAVGILETTDHDQVDLSELKAYENSSFDNENLFIGVASSTTSTFVVSGTLSYEARLAQRQTRDDFSEYESGFLFEEASDEEEGNSG